VADLHLCRLPRIDAEQLGEQIQLPPVADTDAADDIEAAVDRLDIPIWHEHLPPKLCAERGRTLTRVQRERQGLHARRHFGASERGDCLQYSSREGDFVTAIQCSRCGGSASDGARFCVDCGAPLPWQCTCDRIN